MAGQTENVSSTKRGRPEVFKFKKKSHTVLSAALAEWGGALEKSSKTTFTDRLSGGGEYI
jgi:hypothetical protein